MASLSVKKLSVRAGVSVTLIGVLLVLGYASVGHLIVKALYTSNLSLAQKVMAGRSTVPLEVYYDAADKIALMLAAYMIFGGILWALFFKDPIGLGLSGASLLAGSLAIFAVLELVPDLVKPLHFDVIPYFNFRLTYVPDPVLGYREKPFRHDKISNFRGFGYSPTYGIDVSPKTIEWQTDAEGFRNTPGISAADIAVIGSSFPEYGPDLDATYGERLQKHSGYSVVTLGKAGYGPLQYTEVLNRYAISKKPRFAVYVFYPTTDIQHVKDWLSGRQDASLEKRRIAFGNFFQRYGVAASQTWQLLQQSLWATAELQLQSAVGTDVVQPDVAVLRLANITERVVFMDHHATTSVSEKLQSKPWLAWEQLLAQFKNASEANGITPILLFVPAASEVYAQYSTPASGENWLRVRDSLVASETNNEQATREIATKLGIQMISLRPAFQDAAQHGKLVYLKLDSHWNEEGADLAARVTAEALQQIRASTPPLELANTQEETVIERSMNGLIRFWDRRAEELYGWRSEEALGRITHSLLKTQFPEPLEKINAELAQTGKWEGKLVHTTEDGRRIVVGSRWLLEREGGSDVVIEINNVF